MQRPWKSEHIGRSALTRDRVHLYLDELARRCEVSRTPSTFVRRFYSRIRIAFAANAYALILMENVVHAPGKPQSDFLYVFGRGSQLLREDILRQINGNNANVSSPPPTMTNAIVQLTPPSRDKRSVILLFGALQKDQNSSAKGSSLVKWFPMSSLSWITL